MRIIAGAARGKRLKGFPGQNVRPTADRVREALFSMLASRIGPFDGLKVVDLFAGTGALGIEALSRGASHACFVDQDRRSIQLVHHNLDLCQLQSAATVVTSPAESSMGRLSAFAPFDIAFLDPPYGQGLAEKVLNLVVKSRIMTGKAWICIETDQHDQLPDQVADFNLQLRRNYGRTLIHLYCNTPEEHE